VPVTYTDDRVLALQFYSTYFLCRMSSLLRLFQFSSDETWSKTGCLSVLALPGHAANASYSYQRPPDETTQASDVQSLLDMLTSQSCAASNKPPSAVKPVSRMDLLSSLASTVLLWYECTSFSYTAVTVVLLKTTCTCNQYFCILKIIFYITLIWNIVFPDYASDAVTEEDIQLYCL